ncbi:MAG: hypothetical protein GX573_16005, partial [Chloroflexi bacterium]|nr:hypothetical protein [Chloroflexota bacterium]
GKCTPCREGTYWLDRIYERLMRGEGTQHDLDMLTVVPKQMAPVTLCALGEFAANPVLSTVTQFREEYERYIRRAEAEHPELAETMRTVTRGTTGEIPEAVAEGGL